MENLASLAIVAAIVALVQQFIKGKIGAWGIWAKILVIVLSLAGAGIYYWLSKNPNLWQNFLAILAIASTLYGLIVKDLFPPVPPTTA